MRYEPKRLKSARARLTDLRQQLAYATANPQLNSLVPGINDAIRAQVAKIAQLEATLDRNGSKS